MKSKKLLSLLLAVIMIMSAVPMFASAATQIALKATHVTEWPTAEGEIYYGEPLSKIKLIGGKVVYEGVEVPGHFEHIDPNVSAEEAMEGYQADIKFVPDDTDTYKGFSKMFSKTTFTVHKTTPVLADESKPPVVTGTFEAGTTLSAITISDGGMINPYDPDETSVKKATWKWADPNTVITESGYYEAKFSAYSYVTLKEFFLIRIKGDTSEVKIGVTISELPTVDGTVTVGDLWSDVKFTGGKVVDMNGEEVSGTFVTDLDFPVSGINNSVQVKFIPDDDRYATITSDKNIKITAEPGPIKFVDENGNEILPEITVPYGTKVKDLETRLKRLATNCNELLFYNLSANDDVSLTVGTHTLEVLIFPSKTIGVTPNYLDTVLTFKVVVEPVEFAASSASYYAGTEEIHVTFNSSKAPGTFDVFVDGKLIGDDVKLANDYIDVPYKLETSGKHTVKVVYNPIENDYYFMADYETEIQANVRRYITLKDMSDSQYINVNGKETHPSTAYILYGDEISIKYGFEDLFVSWVITDAAGKEIALDGVDLTSSEISFAMPDHDLVISVKTTLDEEEPDDGNDDGTDDGIFGSICSFLQKIIGWFISIIKQMMNLLGLGA